MRNGGVDRLVYFATASAVAVRLATGNGSGHDFGAVCGYANTDHRVTVKPFRSACVNKRYASAICVV